VATDTHISRRLAVRGVDLILELSHRRHGRSVVFLAVGPAGEEVSGSVWLDALLGDVHTVLVRRVRGPPRVPQGRRIEKYEGVLRVGLRVPEGLVPSPEDLSHYSSCYVETPPTFLNERRAS